jgi:septum formation protein
MDLFLASASPRRIALLTTAGLAFTAIPADVDESLRGGEGPRDYVRRVALSKAAKVFSQVSPSSPRAIVLGADTAVILGDRVLGKPKDRQEAASMLGELSGRPHVVLTGYAVVSRQGDRQGLASTTVWLRDLTESEIQDYLDSGEAMDKAGAYAIQGDYGPFLVDRLEGSLPNVVGLPLGEALRLIREASLAMGPG